MDPHRFDAIARSAVTSPSRRLAIPAMVAALFGLPQIAEARQRKEDDAPQVTRPDTSKFDKDVGNGKLLGGGVQTEAVGIRQIWYRDCSTPTATFCGVRCPSTRQAIGGGVLELSPNAVFFFDRPGDTTRDWWAGFGSDDALSATARAFVVCLKK